MKQESLINYFKRRKLYLYYLFLVTVVMFLLFVFFYQNPNFLALFQDQLAIAETEENIDNPFSNSSNTTVVSSFSNQTWAWPTVGTYYISQSYSNSHDGLDIAGCSYNSNIYAANQGKVVTVARKWDNGLYIVIKHPNGYYTMYAHLATVAVTVGTEVRSGQIIGGMGRSGNATGVHLHFSLWSAYPYQGRSMNPFQLY